MYLNRNFDGISRALGMSFLSPSESNEAYVEMLDELELSGYMDHADWKNPMYGKKHTEESKRRMSEAAMGKQKRLGAVLTAETRAKCAATHKALGKAWYNDGTNNVMAGFQPVGFVKGRLAGGWGRHGI